MEILSSSFEIELISFPVVLAATVIGLRDTYNVVTHFYYVLPIRTVFASIGGFVQFEARNKRSVLVSKIGTKIAPA